ncbi:MAG TPA: HAD family hydrolase [Coleofasciculaceae cyanobacterium]|jgi:hypothetical protein
MQPLKLQAFRSIRLVATDMDGTLTQQGKFTPALLQAIADLGQAGIQVLIITGRSAGWVNGIASYLPVVGAIAENGGILYRNSAEHDVFSSHRNGAEPEFLGAIDSNHRQRLAEMFDKLRAEFPQIQESVDNQFRLTDWTFDVFGLGLAELRAMGDRCLAEGLGFTYSTVQCHIKPLHQDKAIGLSKALSHYFPNYQPTEIVTVGDSPNDESLFDGDRFPLSVGVANVRDYAAQLSHQPAYITEAPEAEGFCELAKFILQAHAKR